MTTDLYLPLIGLKPNSSYIPEALLNPKGFVVVDEYLRVKGAEGLWAVGDISAIQKPQYMNTEAQSVHLAKNLGLVLQKKQPLPYAIGGKGKSLLFSAAVIVWERLRLICCEYSYARRPVGTKNWNGTFWRFQIARIRG
jgi:NADH dehydrogenase FAD-containing subunit